MADPVIAVVGSVNPERTNYEPPLRNVDEAAHAAEQLGRELANAGYRLSVYTSEPGYIEADVVRGYAASNKAKPESIQVHFPQVIGARQRRQFPEELGHPELFDLRTGKHESWEVAFYASLKDAGGILLLGGAHSALATGMVALIYRVPLVAVGTFGGSAQTVCTLASGTLTSDEEWRLMARERWSDDLAPKLVKIFADQRRRLQQEQDARLRSEEEENRKDRRRLLVAGGCMIGAVTLMVVGAFGAISAPALFALPFFGTPMLAGASGGIARLVMVSRVAGGARAMETTLGAAMMGMIAGFLAALLFVLAQAASNPEIRNLDLAIPPQLKMLILFGLAIGFIGGFTLEGVFGKLQQADVLNTDPLASSRPHGP